MLATTITGEPRGDTPPLLIVHGLFGSARNWGVIAKRLSDERQVIAVDMRNHGASPWEETHSYKDMAGDLAEVIEAHGGRMDVLGHSMGGKAAMVLALSKGELVNRLVVADIAPTRYGHSQMQNLEAMRGLDLSHIRSRGEAERALEASVPEKGVRTFLAQSLDVAEKKWRLNLDVLAEYMDETLDFPEVSGSFEGPVMFLTGAESTYVRPQHRPEIKRLFPHAVFVKIPGAGHWVHADKPREFEAAVRVWLNK